MGALDTAANQNSTVILGNESLQIKTMTKNQSAIGFGLKQALAQAKHSSLVPAQ